MLDSLVQILRAILDVLGFSSLVFDELLKFSSCSIDSLKPNSVHFEVHSINRSRNCKKFQSVEAKNLLKSLAWKSASGLGVGNSNL